MLHDLERGNRLELDWLAGYVVKLGRELGVATPANDAVYKILKLHRMGFAGPVTGPAPWQGHAEVIADLRGGRS